MSKGGAEAMTMCDDTKPLDLLQIDVTKNGKMMKVPALYKGFAKARTFLLYEPPPVAGPVAADLMLETRQDMWLESMAFFCDDLKFLLALPHHRFWSQVVYDVGLHTSLESYLSQAVRGYDVSAFLWDSAVNGTREAQIHGILSDLHRLVFLVYHRMATFKESKSCHISPPVFGKLLYKFFLYDIPKMMDLCAIYGHDNKSVLQKMIDNIFSTQPKYFHDLGVTVPVILQAFANVEVRLFLRPHDANNELVTLQSRQGEKSITDIAWSDLLDVIMYVLDMASTVHSFLEVFPPGCKAFLLGSFPIRVAAFYELVIPSFVKEVHRRSNQPDVSDMINKVKKCISLARICLLNAFRQVLATCCIHPILEESGSSECHQHVDELLHIMTSILPERSFVADYHSRFSFSDDIDIMQQTGVLVDFNQFEYILEGFNTIVSERETGLATQVLDMTRNMPSKSKKSRSKPDTIYSGECVENGRAASATSSNYGAETGAACGGITLTGIELDSCVSQIKDLFSDLGDGFVEACLGHYNYNCETVINALLEGTLPSQIDMIDRKLPKSSKQLVEAQTAAPTILSERRNVFDGDEFDVFHHDNVDKSRVHRGKGLNTKSLRDNKGHVDEDIKLLTLNLSDKLELEGRSRPAVSLLDPYDDEYDDTYDEQMVGDTGGSTLDELLERRPFGVPRVLAAHDESEEDNDTDNGNENYRDSNERGPPRDQFIQDPAMLRERAAQRWQDKRGGGVPYNNRNVRGRPRGQGQEENVVRSRANKEKNKSSSANHSRRFMGDRKRSSGMYPS